MSLVLTAPMSATDGAIQKKKKKKQTNKGSHGSWTTALIILNEEMEDIIEIVKSWRIRITNKRN